MARRSLMSTTDPAQATGFRRIQLDQMPKGTGGRAPLQDGPRNDPQDDPHNRADRRSLQDAQQDVRRPSRTPEDNSAQADESGLSPQAEAPPATPTPDLLAVPQPPTSGQTSRLAGAMGVMAQLFGQDLEARRPTLPRDAQAGSAAYTASSEAEPSAPVSTLRTLLGIGTYEAVNRVIGAATERLSRFDGVEYLFAMPSGSASLNEVA